MWADLGASTPQLPVALEGSRSALRKLWVHLAEPHCAVPASPLQHVEIWTEVLLHESHLLCTHGHFAVTAHLLHLKVELAPIVACGLLQRHSGGSGAHIHRQETYHDK